MAVIVNTKKTYLNASRALAHLPKDATDHEREQALLDLATSVEGEWSPLNAVHDPEIGDIVIGTYDGLATCVFTIAEITQTRPGDTTSPLRFTVTPAPHWAHLIGLPQPGGPWQRGEARGTRIVPTHTLPTSPDGSDPTRATREVWHATTLNVAHAFHSGTSAAVIATGTQKAWGPRVNPTRTERDWTWPDVKVSKSFQSNRRVLIVTVPPGVEVRVLTAEPDVSGSSDTPETGAFS